MTRTYRGNARTGYTMHCTGCADIYCTCKGALITPEERAERARAVAGVERQEANREAWKQREREGSSEAEWLQDNRAEKNRLAFHAACARLSLEVACNTAGHPIALSQEEASLILTAIVVPNRTGGRQLPMFPPVPDGGCFRWGLCEAPASTSVSTEESKP